MNNNVALFVDGNWLLHRAFHSVGKTSARPERVIPVQVVNWVFSAAIKWSANNIAVFFDGDAVFRYLIYPQYKGKRPGKKEGKFDGLEAADNKNDVYAYLSATQQCLRLSGVYEQQLPEFEADDMVCSASYRWCKEDPANTAVIVAKDKDSRQNVSSRVTVYAPGTKATEDIIWTPSFFLKKTGMTPAQWLRYQILVGDTIDNIPRCMSPKKALSVVKRYASLKDYFESEEGKKFYEENRATLKLNRLLVTMRKDSWTADLGEIRVARCQKSELISEFGVVPSSCSSFNALSAQRSSSGLFGKRL